jgi:hypothetical protein
MIKVFLEPYKDFVFDKYYLDSLNPNGYFDKQNLFEYFYSMAFRKWGANSFGYAEGIDYLYRTNDPHYARYVRDFLDRYVDFDILIFRQNYLHPEILNKYFKNKVKILGFIDDPVSSYTRGIPYLWAFDGAFYISTSYENESMESALKKWGVKNMTWFPLCPQTVEHPSEKEGFFENRNIDLVYIGGCYGPKMDRLIQLKKHFGKRLNIYGRCSLGGWVSVARGLLGKPVLWQKIQPLSDEQRASVYYGTKIGINMHLSTYPSETGNMRMYEIPYYGMMQICDVAGVDGHAKIFEPNKEAVFYNGIDDAIDKIEYYLENDDERRKIAEAGHRRVLQDYNYEENLKRVLDWSAQLIRMSK